MHQDATLQSCTAIDILDSPYYTAADGDGQTTAARAADVDVGGDPRPAAEIHSGGFNLGLLMRQLIGVGTPRGLQGRLIAAIGALLMLIRAFWQLIAPHWQGVRVSSALGRVSIARHQLAHLRPRETALTTGR